MIPPYLLILCVLSDSPQNDLIEVGFVFRAGKITNWRTLERKSWDDRFRELLAFKEEHGHTLVPQLSGPLGGWVKDQRTGYRRMKKGQTNIHDGREGVDAQGNRFPL